MAGWITAPAYDSGWVNVPGAVTDWGYLTLTHGLGTTNVLVDLRRNSADYGVSDGGEGPWQMLYWCNLTDTSITLRYSNDNPGQVRVMLWKIA
jgi:hypothetical protein